MSNCSYSFVLFLTFICLTITSSAQDTTSSSNNAPDLSNKKLGSIDKKITSIESKLDHQTRKYLSKLQKQEHRLQKQLLKKDSLLAHELFGNMNNDYQSIQSIPQNLSKYSYVYSGHLDSLTTALSFLKDINTASLSSRGDIKETLEHLNSLQGRLNQTDQVSKYLDERKQLLKQSLQKLGMGKQLKKYQKQVYFYNAQVKEYKHAFEDPNKLEAKLLEIALKIPQFKDFFAKNSQLGSLFALPGSGSDATASLQGLQTRAMLNEQIAQRFGSGTEVTQMLQQNIQAAQSYISVLKDKVDQYSSGSYGNESEEMQMPDYAPKNNQKTKSFLKRLEAGSNIQSQKARSVFPVTSDIATTLGYKLSDKNVIGIGISYRVGWGQSIQNIRITHQGIGLRSYIDMKVKGSFYINGGYELNQWTLIRSMEQLKNYSAWQESGLIGISKRYNISKKIKGNMQLLWDFLSYQQVPKTQSILWRIGYTIK